MEAHLAHNQEHVGSSPISAIGLKATLDIGKMIDLVLGT